jgi:hypothetical protein
MEQAGDQRAAVELINWAPRPSAKTPDGAFNIFANCADVLGAIGQLSLAAIQKLPGSNVPTPGPSTSRCLFPRTAAYGNDIGSAG